MSISMALLTCLFASLTCTKSRARSSDIDLTPARASRLGDCYACDLDRGTSVTRSLCAITEKNDGTSMWLAL
jgi:hypothetical protein